MAAAEAAMHSPGSEVQGLDWGLLLSRHATCSSPNLVSGLLHSQGSGGRIAGSSSSGEDAVLALLTWE